MGDGTTSDFSTNEEIFPWGSALVCDATRPYCGERKEYWGATNPVPHCWGDSYPIC